MANILSHQIDDKVKIKYTGLKGQVVGISVCRGRAPMYCIEFVNYDGMLVNVWYYDHQLLRIEEAADKTLPDNVVPLKRRTPKTTPKNPV